VGEGSAENTEQGHPGSRVLHALDRWAVTQRKLDEILRASPEADNSMITLGEAPDKELKAAAEAHRDARHDARHEPRNDT